MVVPAELDEDFPACSCALVASCDGADGEGVTDVEEDVLASELVGPKSVVSLICFEWAVASCVLTVGTLLGRWRFILGTSRLNEWQRFFFSRFAWAQADPLSAQAQEALGRPPNHKLNIFRVVFVDTNALEWRRWGRVRVRRLRQQRKRRRFCRVPSTRDDCATS